MTQRHRHKTYPEPSGFDKPHMKELEGDELEIAKRRESFHAELASIIKTGKNKYGKASKEDMEGAKKLLATLKGPENEVSKAIPGTKGYTYVALRFELLYRAMCRSWVMRTYGQGLIKGTGKPVEIPKNAPLGFGKTPEERKEGRAEQAERKRLKNLAKMRRLAQEADTDAKARAVQRRRGIR